MADDGAPKLKQTLRGFQIFFIVLSAIIGGGIFNQNGEALELAGPGGMIVAMIFMGLVTIAMSEGVSEFTQMFPAPNAIVEYVRTFVDEDLGWVVGIAFWYTFAAIFAVQNLAAANMSRYWGLAQTWQTIGFYVVAPAIILAINFVGVWLFGIIETIGGVLKVCIVFGTSVVLYKIAANGMRLTLKISGMEGANLYAIPLVAYMYLGVEIIAVTAFEAKRSKDLRLPSQTIAYVVFFLYFLCTIGEALNVSWTSDHLPKIYGGVGNRHDNYTAPVNPSSTSLPIVAVWQAGYPKLAGFLNGCLIFSVLSASNTSLYVASRTLYGMTREIPETNVVGKCLKKLSLVVPQTGVPAAALVISAISFFWLPFVQLKAGYSVQDLIAIIAVTGSVSCLIVWAALSLAFIRYESWLRKCRKDIANKYPEFKRNTKNYKAFTLFAWAQPFPAYFALAGSLIVFGFASATWWDTPVSFPKVAVAYAAHIILFSLWVIFKIINRRWWVKLDPDVSVLVGKLRALEWRKQDEPGILNGEPPRELHLLRRENPENGDRPTSEYPEFRA
ncbi:hypothetical protein H2199_007150 [Coniosporium tulheliwenetii]|uniref:Uncharacterized protein n=1 Tax=Coniosporium tulheliwenetii TaxID=3383036 RepID=A0ACC2YQW2_9PEZI|nr:hypothetical protein H2199_007150 [Cladosporium sp. JES 115]